jgi:hypothetical protein
MGLGSAAKKSELKMRFLELLNISNNLLDHDRTARYHILPLARFSSRVFNPFSWWRYYVDFRNYRLLQHR